MFKVGDKVIYTSNRYWTSSDNPLHKDYPKVTGIIKEISHRIGVIWSNGTENSYDDDDLELVKNRLYDFYEKIS